jgi:hypothetical protein
MTRKLSIFYSSQKKQLSGVRNENKFRGGTNLWRGPLTQTTSHHEENTCCFPVSCEKERYSHHAHTASCSKSEEVAASTFQMLCSVVYPRACLLIYCRCNPTVEKKIVFWKIIMFYCTSWCRQSSVLQHHMLIPCVKYTTQHVLPPLSATDATCWTNSKDLFKSFWPHVGKYFIIRGHENITWCEEERLEWLGNFGTRLM